MCSSLYALKIIVTLDSVFMNTNCKYSILIIHLCPIVGPLGRWKEKLGETV